MSFQIPLRHFSCLLEVKDFSDHYWFLFPIFHQGMTVVIHGFCVFRLKLHSEILLLSELFKRKDQSLLEWCRETLAGKYLGSRSRSASLRAKGYLFSPSYSFSTTNEIEKEPFKTIFHLSDIKLFILMLINMGHLIYTYILLFNNFAIEIVTPCIN